MCLANLRRPVLEMISASALTQYWRPMIFTNDNLSFADLFKAFGSGADNQSTFSREDRHMSIRKCEEDR